MRIDTFSTRYLARAAALGAIHMRDLRRGLPLLPERWTRVETFLQHLEQAAAEGRGVVAMDGDTLVGYMAYSLFPFKGQRAAFSPEYGHATLKTDARGINERLYAEASRRWADDGRSLHLIAWTPNDDVAEQTWLWQGFGLLCIDALRDLAPLGGVTSPAAIRAAGPQDVALCQPLGARLSEHLSAPSVFVHGHVEDEQSWRRTLSDTQRHVALAIIQKRPVGYLRIGPASQNACTIIEDPGTASITGAYVDAEFRGSGIAAALLDDCLRWARDRGYQRCAVDFESANTPAACFWTRHFAPVSLGGMRFIDIGLG